MIALAAGFAAPGALGNGLRVSVEQTPGALLRHVRPISPVFLVARHGVSVREAVQKDLAVAAGVVGIEIVLAAAGKEHHLFSHERFVT